MLCKLNNLAIGSKLSSHLTPTNCEGKLTHVYLPYYELTLLTDARTKTSLYPWFRSSLLINPNYNVYQESDINEENTSRVENNDDDDFLADPISVSVSDKRFTYGASPGFLQDNVLNSTSSPRFKSHI